MEGCGAVSRAGCGITANTTVTNHYHEPYATQAYGIYLSLHGEDSHGGKLAGELPRRKCFSVPWLGQFLWNLCVCVKMTAQNNHSNAEVLLSPFDRWENWGLKKLIFLGANYKPGFGNRSLGSISQTSFPMSCSFPPSVSHVSFCLTKSHLPMKPIAPLSESPLSLMWSLWSLPFVYFVPL